MLDSDKDPFAVADSLKMYFREAKKSLIPREFYHEVIDALSCDVCNCIYY